MRRARPAFALLGLCVAGCGVLAPEGAGDVNLPDARLGPFRTFDETEVTLPPLVVLDFAASLGGPDLSVTGQGDLALTMHAASDDDPTTVLRRMTGTTPTAFANAEVILGGEPAGMRDPDLLEDDGTTLVYFGVGTGERIGIARSQGGGPFEVAPAPVLVAADPALEPIGAPSVALVDGVWLLFHERGDAIALAVSEDGQTFQDQGIVLGPGDGSNEGWDAGGVGDPEVAVVQTPLGETRVRLYYTGWSVDDPPVLGVGVAVSFDGRSELRRFSGNPIVALEGDEAAPTVSVGEGDEPALLYFERTSGTGRAGIGGASLP